MPKKRIPFLSFVALVCLALVLWGCSETKTVTKPDAESQMPQETTPRTTTTPPGKTDVVEPISAEVEGVSREQIDASAKRDLQPAMDDLSQSYPDVHFDYDRYEIKPVDEATLKRLADWLVKNPGARITVEGHCDERGTEEYNLALGERRASSIRDYLAASGVDRKRVATISYGEERPLDRSQNETAWAKNRRGHFLLQK